MTQLPAKCSWISLRKPGFSCCWPVVPSSARAQGGAVQAAEAQPHLTQHWYHVVPLSWMALISALSWGRLILTVLTLSPVLHCDTGHRRNSPHSHFSKLQHHLWCHWSQRPWAKEQLRFGHTCASLSRLYAVWFDLIFELIHTVCLM